MTLNKRQEHLLNKVIKEHIRQAEPISSEHLKKRYKIDLSSATIRNEMQRLTDLGYLYQPHTSAGRVPTDKGYRYLVDSLIDADAFDDEIDKEIREMKKAQDCLAFLQETNKLLSSLSSGLVFSFLPDGNFCLREGWIRVFKDPEFSDIRYTRRFLSMIDSFEKNIDEFDLGDFSIKIYIGKEVPIPKSEDFSILVSKFSFKEREGILSIMGPKRMPYNLNVPLINSVIRILKENNL